MNSRAVLDAYGLEDKRELINIVLYSLPDFTLNELNDIMASVELEFQYREEKGLIHGEDL